MTSRHPAIRRLKRTNPAQSLHGNKVWNSALLLIDYLQHHPIASHSQVLELGCGWGMAGIYCAKQLSCAVTGLDADPQVFPYLRLQAAANDVEIDALTHHFADLHEAALGQFDALIGSDICFWDEMADEVLAVIERAVTAGVKRIIIADPNRPPFLEVAEHCVEHFYGELLPWQSAAAARCRGSILLIENA